MTLRSRSPRSLTWSLHAVFSRRTITLLCLLAALTARSGLGAAEADTVAVVNGQEISRAQFGRSLLTSLGGSAIDTYIERVLIAQDARREGITVTDEELRARREAELTMRMRAVQAGTRMGPEEFRQAVTDRGMSMDQIQEDLMKTMSPEVLRSRLLAEKLLKPYVDLGDEALRAYYERTRGRRFAAAHIAVADRRQGQRLLEALKDRKDLWPDAVNAYSLDRASKPYQGRIGPVPAASDLGRFLAGMKPGEMSLWQEGDTCHVMWLLRDIPPSKESFDQLQDRLKVELLAERAHTRVYDLLADLWQGSTVVVNMSSDAAERRLLGEDVAAFVNGEPVRTESLADALVKEFGPATLPSYVERVLIFQEAGRRGLKASPEEVDSRLKAIGERLFADRAAERDMNPQQYGELLEGGGISPQDAKDRLVRESVATDDVRATVLAEKLVADDVKVTDQDVQDLYREQGGERYVVRDLSAKTRADAERVMDRLSEGASFELLARTEPEEPGIWLDGAGLTTVTAGHPWYERVKGLEAGQTSGIFPQDGRYHIIKVVEHHTPSDLPPLQTVREKLEREVFLRKAMVRIQALLIKLRAESQISVNLE